jgi:hypothetical protein
VEKKDFLIPKNCQTKFELIPNIGLKEMLFFIPSIVFVLIIAFFIPISVPTKIVFYCILLFIPFALVGIRPLRENLPAYQMIIWRLQFFYRQKQFLFERKDENE